MPQTVADALDWWAFEAPDRLAISFGDNRVSYAQLKAWTDRVALFLLDKDVNAGDRVGIFAGNSMDWCAAALGAIKTGALVVPLNYRYTTSELTSVVRDCAPKVVITDRPRDDRIQALAPFRCKIAPLSEIAALREGPEPDFEHDLDPRAPAVIAYTSGSTAAPKGVVHSHEGMVAHALEAMLTDSEWRPGKTVLGPAPLYTGAGIITLVKFINVGMSIFYLESFDAAKALRILIDEKIDNFGGVPTFFERIAALPEFEQADLSHIKYSSVGGARVSRLLLEAWLKRGVILRQIYGLTEGGGNTTIMDRQGAIAFPEKCGPGRPYTKHKVVDAEFNRCPPGVPGEIVLKGPTVMLGYWNNPEATAETLVHGGWLRTGDIGVTDEQGNITVVGRLKDIIISGGLNIAPIDVENVIIELDGIEEVAVIAAADERFGETPMAIVHTSKPVAVADIIAHCNRRLADYKVPRYIAFEDAPLPRLATGKISKRELKERYQDAAERLPKVR